MTKYHINKNGVIGKCWAEKSGCPFGGVTGQEDHFGTEKEARDFYETKNQDTTLKSLSKNKILSNFNLSKSFSRDTMKVIELPHNNGIFSIKKGSYIFLRSESITFPIARELQENHYEETKNYDYKDKVSSLFEAYEYSQFEIVNDTEPDEVSYVRGFTLDGEQVIVSTEARYGLSYSLVSEKLYKSLIDSGELDFYDYSKQVNHGGEPDVHLIKFNNDSKVSGFSVLTQELGYVNNGLNNEGDEDDGYYVGFKVNGVNTPISFDDRPVIL